MPDDAFGIEKELNKDFKVVIHHIRPGDLVEHDWFCWEGSPRIGVYMGSNLKAPSTIPHSVLVQWHPVEYWGRISSCSAYELKKYKHP